MSDLTRVVRLLQLDGVDDAEGKPDALGLNLFAEEPVRLHGLVDVVLHHGIGWDQSSSRGGRGHGALHLAGRGLRTERIVESQNILSHFFNLKRLGLDITLVYKLQQQQNELYTILKIK